MVRRLPFLNEPKFLIFVSCFSICYVFTSCQVVASESRNRGAETVQTTLQTPEKKDVSLEISGSINLVTSENSNDPVEISFKEKLLLAQNKTVRLSPSSSSGAAKASANERAFSAEPGLKSELTEGKNKRVAGIDSEKQTGELVIEVTPLQFFENSVQLQLEIFAKNAKGEKLSLAKPKVVAPYGESTEIQEFNTSADAQYSGLRFSFFPQSAGLP